MAAEVQRIAVAAGGQVAFPIILTINGQTLHNHYHGNTLKSGDMVLCDCGTETALHYGGDLSSTFPVDPVFTPRQKEIYEISLAAHEAGGSRCFTGAVFSKSAPPGRRRHLFIMQGIDGVEFRGFPGGIKAEKYTHGP